MINPSPSSHTTHSDCLDTWVAPSRDNLEERRPAVSLSRIPRSIVRYADPASLPRLSRALKNDSQISTAEGFPTHRPRHTTRCYTLLNSRYFCNIWGGEARMWLGCPWQAFSLPHSRFSNSLLGRGNRLSFSRRLPLSCR